MFSSNMENVVPGPIFHDLMLWKVLKNGIGGREIKAFGGPRGLSFGVIQAAIQLRAASFRKPSPSFLLSQGELCMNFLLLLWHITTI